MKNLQRTTTIFALFVGAVSLFSFPSGALAVQTITNTYSTVQSYSSGTSHSFSADLSGATVAIFGACQIGSNASGASATFNGSSFGDTHFQQAPSGAPGCKVGYLFSPSSGSQTFSVSSLANDNAAVFLYAYSGVKTTAVDATNQGSGSSGASATVTTSADKALVWGIAVSADSNSTSINGTSNTQGTTQSSYPSVRYSAGDYGIKTPAGGVSVNIGSGAGRAAVIGYSFAPADSVSSGPTMIMASMF